MLVALPSAIAFGVTVYAPLGGSYAAMGAIAGIIGVVVIGIVAALLGGTTRLISAPCAPAAAVLSAFVIKYSAIGISSDMLLLMVIILGLLAGAMQIIFTRPLKFPCHPDRITNSKGMTNEQMNSR